MLPDIDDISGNKREYRIVPRDIYNMENTVDDAQGLTVRFGIFFMIFLFVVFVIWLVIAVGCIVLTSWSICALYQRFVKHRSIYDLANTP